MGAEQNKEQSAQSGNTSENKDKKTNKSKSSKKNKSEDEEEEEEEDDEEEEEEEDDEEESEKKDKSKKSKTSKKSKSSIKESSKEEQGSSSKEQSKGKEKESKSQSQSQTASKKSEEISVSQTSKESNIESEKNKSSSKQENSDSKTSSKKENSKNKSSSKQKNSKGKSSSKQEENEEEDDDEEEEEEDDDDDEEKKTKSIKDNKDSSNVTFSASNKEENKSKDTKSKKKTLIKKHYKDVLPGEIPEERKISKAAKMSFGYTCCQTIENAHEKEITTLCYILKRNEIATASVDEKIKIWKISYKKGEISLYKELTGHTDSITCLRDFEKLNCFCSTSSDLTIKLWDTSSLKCIQTLKYHTKCILACCYNPTTKTEIFTAGEDLDILVWSTPKGIEEFHEKKALKGHKKRISSLAFADEYDYLISGSDDKTLRIWDLKNIEDITCIKVISDLMSQIDFLFYLDNRLIVGCEDGVISFIKMNKLKRCRSVKFAKSPIYSFYIFHKKRYLIIGCKDGKTRVWKIGTNKREVLIGHTDAVTGVCDFEDDFIVTASIDKSIKLWKKG